MLVEYHNISVPGESVLLECGDNNTVFYQVHANDSVTILDNPVYTVSSPAHQSKFLCVLQLDKEWDFPEVTEVHYVVIQGLCVSAGYI